MSAPSYQSVQEAKITQVCPVSFCAIKDSPLSTPAAPLLGMAEQKTVLSQCQFENEIWSKQFAETIIGCRRSTKNLSCTFKVEAFS